MIDTEDSIMQGYQPYVRCLNLKTKGCSLPARTQRIATLVAVKAAGQDIHAFDSCPKVQRHMRYQQTRRDGRFTMIPRSANTACNSSNSRAPLLFLSYCSCQAGNQPFTLLTAPTLYMRQTSQHQPCPGCADWCIANTVTTSMWLSLLDACTQPRILQHDYE